MTPSRPSPRIEMTPKGARVVVGESRNPGPREPSSKGRWKAWWRLIRADRPIGILLLLWPTLWALWLAAEGFPPPGILLIFVAGVVLTRSAGCVINDYADRWLDPQVARTRDRPLATGELSGREALLGFVVLMALAFGLVLLTNWPTILLSGVALLLAIIYPFCKRVMGFPQVVLGAAFSMAIPMAFTAVTGEVSQLAWLLFAANLLWTTAYDTLYGMIDREDDLRAGARSTAILLGDLDRLGVGLLHGSFLLAMALLGQRAELGWPYCVGLALAAGLIGWQLWLARDQAPSACFRAFLLNNRVGSVIFIGLALQDLAG